MRATLLIEGQSFTFEVEHLEINQKDGQIVLLLTGILGKKDKADTDIGALVGRERKRRGLTQQELAEKIGYKSKVVISGIERGKISIPGGKLPALAQVLNLQESDLY